MLPITEFFMFAKQFALPLIALLTLIGCGNNQPAQTNQPTTSNAKSTLPAISVTVSADMPPFSFIDEHGKPTGIEVDIIKAIAAQQAFEVTFHHQPFSKILPSIESGKYQVAFSDITVTPERAVKFDHTTPYVSNPVAIAHSPEFAVQTLQDLKPLQVATLKGSFHNKAIKELAPAQHYEVDTSFLMLQGIAQSKFDAVLDEEYILKYLLAKYPEIKVKTAPIPSESSDIAMFVKKGDTELLNKLNAGIAHLKQTGELDKIIAKYMQNPAK